MSGLISINPDECRTTMNTLRAQRESIKAAISKVEKSPDMMPAWKGNRSTQYRQQVTAEMKKLEQAANTIDEAIKNVEASLKAFAAADGVSL